jgi:predicted amidohydrolase YtcJ
MRIICFLFGLLFFLASCNQDKKATMIIKGGDIYTVDTNQPTVEAVAVLDGRIVAMGDESEMNNYADEKTEIIDATGSFVMPGFIEGHGHFSGLGKSLQELNLLKTTSWDEIVKLVEKKARDAKPGEWITGRGWHQEKWSAYPGQTYFGYPDHKKLSAVSPDNPVMLIHASGHGLFANAKAMEMAQINLETLDPAGGAVIRNDQGEAIGVFEERAMAMIRDVHQNYLNSIDPGEREAQWEESIVLATEECLRKGVTSFQDAGSSFEEIEAYTQMARDETLGIRLWAMIRRSSEEMAGRLAAIKTIDEGDHYFTCRAIKTEIDGALGSYGAWLLESYSDKPNFVGQNTTELSEVRAIGKLAEKNDMQLCIHTIGDRGNQEILNLIEKDFPQSKDKRWRMEHAQHLAVSDIPRFAELGVIASMQAIHCTSDSPFVVARLGEQRARTGA